MRAFRSKIALWILFSGILLLACILLSLCIGNLDIPPWKWFSLQEDSIEYTILTQLRLPRMLTAVGVGGMLSLSGCILQGIFRNPLVEPYTLGISGGASLGVAAAFVCGASHWGGLSSIGLLALAGSIGISTLLLAYYHFRPDINNLLLAGIMLGILCSACTTLLMSLSSPEDIARIVYWTMGSLENSRPMQASFLCILALAFLVSCILLSQRINVLDMGMETARHLGVNTRILVPILMVFCSCMTALSVATAGIIGFIGLVVPHILRNTAGNDYRLLVPASFLCGGSFMLICDGIARTIIQPSQLPIGVVTGILGGGLFVYLLLRPKKHPHA